MAALEDAVVAAVVAAAGGAPETEFGVFVRDPDGRMVAGIAGSVWGGCCHLQSMWVDESRRGRGWARGLMLAAEAEARRRGCDQAMVLSYDLVLPGFYPRLGYETVAVLHDCPRGSALRWYRKHLRSSR